LLAQDFPLHAYEVRLYISKESYLLDEGCPRLTEELEQLKLANQDRFSVVYVENTGPYRKILPVLTEVYDYEYSLFSRTLIVTTDDDTIYPPNLLRKLYSCYLKYNCVVGFRGRVAVFNEDRLETYGNWTKEVNVNPSVMNVPTGKDGVLYSPFHFHPSVLEIKNAQFYASKADDLWLKIHTLLLGVPCFICNKTLSDEFPSVGNINSEVSLYESFNRDGGNDRALRSLDDYLAREFEFNTHELLKKSGADVVTQSVKSNLFI
jgi:hypothetical protein